MRRFTKSRLRESNRLPKLLLVHGLALRRIHEIVDSAQQESRMDTLSGDRGALAAMMKEHEPLIRARIRRSLNASMRKLFDSQDVFATVVRRVDRLAARGELRARSQAELVSLLSRIAENVVIDRARVIKRLRGAIEVEAEWARAFADRIDRDGGDAPHAVVLSLAFEALDDADDKAILSLWLNGTPHAGISAALGVPESTVRSRWQSIRRRLAVVAKEVA